MPEAVLLVGGQGTRLRPLTFTTPKQMLPVAGVPLLTHLIVKLRDAGVDHVVLATSYRSEVFAEHFGDGSALGVALTYVREVEPLGTGGAIGNVAAHLRSGPDDPVVVVNGDNLSGHDLLGQLTFHRDRRADVTLHLVEVPDARAFGCVPCDDDGRVLAFLEKMPEPVTHWVNAGCYVFRRSVVDAIPQGRPVSVERETFPGLLAEGGRVFAWRETSFWSDVGTPATYVRTSADLVLRDGPAWLADTAAVADGAEVSDGSSVGAGAVVATGARVLGSVVMSGAQVGDGAHVERSAVGAGAVVAAGAVLVDAVVGDGAVVGSGNELRGGARVWPGVVLAPTSVRFSPDP
jgi:mannose-1-phosphate guanylyltransferase